MSVRRSYRRYQPFISPKSIEDFVRDRELGLKKTPLLDDYFFFKFYSSFDQFNVQPKPTTTRKYGGVFNLEFSQDGRLLVAACEEKSVLLYDAATQKCFKTITEAHSNCVNCVRFLDAHTFATCSDDKTIKLWDLRNLRKETRSLYGHSNWVKNIEYSKSENLLVTSAFDGSIYTWDIKGDSEYNTPYNTAFLMNGIMRTKLTPDGDKMVISTTSGYMIIIHDLHLATLANDLGSFKPDIYRLMQLTEQNFPAGNIFNFLFHPSRRRNRIEFIDDFPNKSEVISSLQIHPHGWSALSRNINGDENQDWTCVHDIQSREPAEYMDYLTVNESNELVDDDEGFSSNNKPTDLWVGLVTNDLLSNERNPFPPTSVELPPFRSMNSGLLGRNAYKTFLRQYPNYQNKLVRNLPRLTHYKREESVGKGFIKEVCFSQDGRVICSPYKRGIRILGFSEKAEELPYCLSKEAQKLHTLVTSTDYHKDVVVCCKFNPVHMRLVSGCLGGDIVWYDPCI
ncbi:DDB1- and CUL4-associated factor 10 [Harmonia axyridis]|uniref:DDB1- and CUL4-associated factor 10 n=1 Tax=Harmonia axyridis TaxID=115357 RepID=UPI001E279082|nr:DDB1- and CUL4-associated factor 10 [Harmonia axyridis]